MFPVLLMLLFLSFNNKTAYSQSTYQLVSAQSSIKITGTSNLHDWEMNLKKMEASFQASSEQSLIKSIQGVNFKCRSTDLLSESSIMNDKAHDALKAKPYPEISFSNTIVEKWTIQNDKGKGLITGDLRLAGKTRRISIPFEGSITNNSLQVNGTCKLLMSDFGISPPSAMLGALKTGNEVTIAFKLSFIHRSK